MQSELMRASKELAKADPAPYYLSYSVADQDTTVVAGANGAIVTSVQSHARRVDVITRIGSPALDNTHGELRTAAVVSGTLPLNQDHAAIARTLWDLTNRGYRQSVSAYMRAKTSSDVRAAEEDDSPDFSKQAPQTHVDVAALLPASESLWRERVRKMAAHFRAHPEVETSGVVVVIQNEDHYFVTTEGTRLLTPVRMARLFVFASMRAEDGMDLTRMESFQSSDPEKLPGETQIAPQIAKMIADLKALKASPIAEPFAGPALLSGRAAAVLTHEVLGHRLEGQRQRGDDEGQTFTKKINQAVLPQFISVVDDPTRKTFGATDLSGFYQFDDEGTPAQAVKLIDDGVLRNFLLSRMPVKGFQTSNGHGRGEAGRVPVGRQGNLIVSSTKSVPEGELRQQLIAEVKRQGKPYGLYFDDIQGGFTVTSRQAPQAFQVLPIMVWRVYPDGRPDELVRGVDLVGTPLAAFAHIISVGDTEHVFNGICGAESGSVPVAAIAPAMLFSEFETQRRAQSHQRPPILPPPTAADIAGGVR
ncbi:MAG: metallopeptidase TldD-related protein [Acidobacteriota bacterium]|nr:metallopeptidase TldD-related protein [Acidobacteriota bacterium]